MNDELIKREALIERIDSQITFNEHIGDLTGINVLMDCRAALSRSSSEASSQYVQMIFNDYQEWTATTAIYNDKNYPLLGLAEETGELLGKFAKYKRDDTEFPRDAIIKEAGDVLWMLARILHDHGIGMQEAIDANITKLESRKQRNVISGSGDDR